MGFFDKLKAAVTPTAKPADINAEPTKDGVAAAYRAAGFTVTECKAGDGWNWELDLDGKAGSAVAIAWSNKTNADSAEAAYKAKNLKTARRGNATIYSGSEAAITPFKTAGAAASGGADLAAEKAQIEKNVKTINAVYGVMVSVGLDFWSTVSEYQKKEAKGTAASFDVHKKIGGIITDMDKIADDPNRKSLIPKFESLLAQMKDLMARV